MKTPFQTSRTRARSSVGFILSLLLWCAASTASAALLVGFEEDEGYEVGALGTQNGWISYGASPGNFIKVNDTVFKTGDQSLSVGKFTAAGNTAYVVSPDVSSEGYTSVSFSTRASLTPQTATSNINYTRFRLTLSGSGAIATRQLELYIRQESSGKLVMAYSRWSGEDVKSNPVVTLDDILTPTEWADIQITLSPTFDSYSIFVNGTRVVTDSKLHSDLKTGTAFSNMIIYSYTSDFYDGIVYYDDIHFTHAIPEPATAGLLMIVGIGGCTLALARRKR